MFTPNNEQGVIVKFSQECHKFGMEILSIQTEYPDAIVLWKGQELRVEFEYQSSNFYSHKHDPRQCDLIVCWNDDYAGALPVIAIKYDSWMIDDDFRLATEEEKYLEYLKMCLSEANNRIRQLENEIEIARRKNGLTLSDNQAEEICHISQGLNIHDMALLLFNFDLISSEQAANIIGVKDIRTVQSRASKLNGVAK
jgi:hypothetical protein